FYRYAQPPVLAFFPTRRSSDLVELRASGLEMVRFYGFRNETDASQPDSVYRVDERQSLFAPAATVPLAPRLRLTLGPLVKYAHTDRKSTRLNSSHGSISYAVFC